jgi:uncharacterized protein (DUF1499 family)
MSIPLVMLSVLVIGCSGVRPTNLGVKEGLLAPCPTTPNCVSSRSADKEHAIAPLQYRESASDMIAELKKVILTMKRAEIVVSTDSYLHAEFTSAVFLFVDDVEFLCDDRARLIHVRSASRVGRSDSGVNRKRVEEIRQQWIGAGK